MPISENPAPGAHRAQGVRRAAMVLLAVEAAALLAVATLLLVRSFTGTGLPTLAIALAVFLLVFAAALALAVRSLAGGTRFGIGFGITWQLFQALVGASMLNSGLVLTGFLAILTAVATFVLLTKLSHERAREEIERAARGA